FEQRRLCHQGGQCAAQNKRPCKPQQNTASGRECIERGVERRKDLHEPLRDGRNGRKQEIGKEVGGDLPRDRETRNRHYALDFTEWPRPCLCPVLFRERWGQGSGVFGAVTQSYPRRSTSSQATF